MGRLPFRLHRAGGAAAITAGTALFGRRLYLENVEHINPERLRFRGEGLADVWNYWNNAAGSLLIGAAASAATLYLASRSSERMVPEQQTNLARWVAVAAVVGVNAVSETDIGQHVVAALGVGDTLRLTSQPHLSDFVAGTVCGAIGALSFKAVEQQSDVQPLPSPLDDSPVQL